MAAFQVDFTKVHEFADARAFYDWLASHHDVEDEVWIKIHKMKSGLASITAAQAIEMALCWGWIDGIRKRFDERSFLQRYSRRRPGSHWSRINARSVHRLIASGQMRDRGIVAARIGIAKGKWPKEVGAPSAMPRPQRRKQLIPAQLVCFRGSSSRSHGERRKRE